jgi:hypothetical protein
LPPIILFNFIYEYISKDYVADEMSEQMLETLTGNAVMMDTFKEDVRRNFIRSTIESLVGSEKVDMVYGVLTPFISEKPYDMRLDFKYSIDLRDFHNTCDFGSEWFLPEKYYLVREHISYTKIVTEKNFYRDKLSIGFFADTDTLEKELIGKNYIFRENLIISPPELERIKAMSPEESRFFAENCLQIQLIVNDCPAVIESVEAGDFGITADLRLDKPISENKFNIEIGFTMPQLRHRSEFLVSLPEPTRSPEILFTYNENVTKITAYQFLNDDSKLIGESKKIHGRISLRTREWVYPVKGVLFIVEDIKTAENLALTAAANV